MTECKFQIGGKVIALCSNKDQGNFSIPANYSVFITNNPNDVELSVRRDELPASENWQLAFKTSGPTTYYRDGNSWIVYTQFSSEARPHLVAAFDDNDRAGKIYDLAPAESSGMLPFPLRYPLCEVLMADLLSKEDGLILHASGISSDGSGKVFVGESGAGKTTIAKLFLERDGSMLLNDDRIIIRKKKNGYLMYGTPWHGELTQVSSQNVPLEKIFILNQARENRLIPLTPSQTATALFVRCFPPFWNPIGMDFTLQFIKGLVSSVPCYQLDFLPEPELLSLVL